MTQNLLEQLLQERGALLADGATGTNLFEMGLMSGDAPELWNVDHPERIEKLHQGFVDAGSDIILTNSFGGTRHRLKLHNAQARVFELNKRAAEIARSIADSCGRKVVVAGSVGPTGELLFPLGSLTEEEAKQSFIEQMKGLKAGGADVLWIETMSSIEEIQAAADAANEVDMPYVVTASFDTAGKTMMGLAPSAMPGVFEAIRIKPTAVGANCGVGASDLLGSVLDMRSAAPETNIVAKANCGIPVVKGDSVVYTGTPELMQEYVKLALDAGAKIIGGCCGTSSGHLTMMRKAMDAYLAEGRTPASPSPELIEKLLGPMVNRMAGKADEAAPKRERRRRRSA